MNKSKTLDLFPKNILCVCVIFKMHVILLILFIMFFCVSMTNAYAQDPLASIKASGLFSIDTAVSPQFKEILDKKGPFVAVLGSGALADKYTTAFMQNGWKVVTRSQLQQVLSEQKLSMSGLLDNNARLAIGRILGINFIITFTKSFSGLGYIPNGQPVLYDEGSLQIIDVETGTVVASSHFKWEEHQDQAYPSWVLVDLHNKVKLGAYQTSDCYHKCENMYEKGELATSLQECIRILCR